MTAPLKRSLGPGYHRHTLDVKEILWSCSFPRLKPDVSSQHVSISKQPLSFTITTFRRLWHGLRETLRQARIVQCKIAPSEDLLLFRLGQSKTHPNLEEPTKRRSSKLRTIWCVPYQLCRHQRKKPSENAAQIKDEAKTHLDTRRSPFSVDLLESVTYMLYTFDSDVLQCTYIQSV